MNRIETLVQNLKEGDEAAFDELYLEFEASLYNHLLRMIGQREKAQELFQETMLVMIRKIDFYSYRNELANSFKSWLFRIATNLAIDEIRKTKKISQKQFIDNVLIDDQHILEIDLKDRLNILIMRLPLIQRTFLNLKINEELSHFEIAKICGCDINTVKQGLFRGRKTLKNLLINEGITL